ncbi:MAG: PAS domain-containing sensor histidine kinase [Flavisolibacter sp.]
MLRPKLFDLIDPVSLSHHLEEGLFAVMLWDSNMKLLYCSKKAAAIFGSTTEEILQQPNYLRQYVFPEDAARVSNIIAELTSGRVSQNESLNRNLTKDGKVIYCKWYNSSQKNGQGIVTSILSLFQDVTAQVETEVALSKSEHQLSLAFNSAIDPMWLIKAEGKDIFKFETINSAFTKVTGWTPEQVEGQPIENIMPLASHDLVKGKYNDAIETGKTIDYFEEAQHPSGIKYGEIRVIPILSDSASFPRILGIANDITEKVYLQKKLDAEREIKTRQITSAAIKGQESERSKVSRELHDNINQVLTTVKLYVELCIDQKVDTVPTLQKCSELLTGTINEIRYLSKQLSPPSLGSINFRETFSELIEASASSTLLDARIEFDSLSFQEMETELHLALYRVAQEQLTNISRYAKANSVSVYLKQDKSILQFTISDDGQGFDPTQKRKGIGITNMQSRVETLNGQFRIISSPGKGTRLEVEIPVIIEDNVCFAEQAVLDTLSPVDWP